ncbi:MAG: hypothetical protein DRP47_04615 [Candidatus Zixiibacteriota bacterium]|nr:MAG: hypothetical protein DRP47_04615 [candidate division Zixibacteria bacterium]
MIRKLAFSLLALVLMIWAVGCSDNPAETTTNQTLDLDSEFGGYTASAEKPGFDDPDLVAEADADEDYDDVMLASPAVEELIADPDAGYYHIRAVWGRLCYDSTVTEVTDWTGSLAISRGVEIIRRVIRFEPGDYILERTDPALIEWHSLTTVHNDGIAVDLFVPRPKPILDSILIPEVDSLDDTIWVTVIDTTYPELEPVTLTFETGPYSYTFSMEELVSLDTIVIIDDSNVVVFHGFKLDRFPCPRGFLSGRWGYNEEDEGVFRGTWMSKRGRISGYLKGHYGENSDGLKVFFGKWISSNGKFEGFLKGIYGQHPNYHANEHAFRRSTGWFAGGIFAANGAEIGVLKGRYGSRPNKSKGFFQGRWKLRCNDITDTISNEEEGF